MENKEIKTSVYSENLTHADNLKAIFESFYATETKSNDKGFASDIKGFLLYFQDLNKRIQSSVQLSFHDAHEFKKCLKIYEDLTKYIATNETKTTKTISAMRNFIIKEYENILYSFNKIEPSTANDNEKKIDEISSILNIELCNTPEDLIEILQHAKKDSTAKWVKNLFFTKVKFEELIKKMTKEPFMEEMLTSKFRMEDLRNFLLRESQTEASDLPATFSVLYLNKIINNPEIIDKMTDENWSFMVSLIDHAVRNIKSVKDYEEILEIGVKTKTRDKDHKEFSDRLSIALMSSKTKQMNKEELYQIIRNTYYNNHSINGFLALLSQLTAGHKHNVIPREGIDDAIKARMKRIKDAQNEVDIHLAESKNSDTEHKMEEYIKKYITRLKSEQKNINSMQNAFEEQLKSQYLPLSGVAYPVSKIDPKQIANQIPKNSPLNKIKTANDVITYLDNLSTQHFDFLKKYIPDTEDNTLAKHSLRHNIPTIISILYTIQTGHQSKKAKRIEELGMSMSHVADGCFANLENFLGIHNLELILEDTPMLNKRAKQDILQTVHSFIFPDVNSQEKEAMHQGTTPTDKSSTSRSSVDMDFLIDKLWDIEYARNKASQKAETEAIDTKNHEDVLKSRPEALKFISEYEYFTMNAVMLNGENQEAKLNNINNAFQTFKKRLHVASMFKKMMPEYEKDMNSTNRVIDEIFNVILEVNMNMMPEDKKKICVSVLKEWIQNPNAESPEEVEKIQAKIQSISPDIYMPNMILTMLVAQAKPFLKEQEYTNQFFECVKRFEAQLDQSINSEDFKSASAVMSEMNEEDRKMCTEQTPKPKKKFFNIIRTDPKERKEMKFTGKRPGPKSNSETLKGSKKFKE